MHRSSVKLRRELCNNTQLASVVVWKVGSILPEFCSGVHVGRRRVLTKQAQSKSRSLAELDVQTCMFVHTKGNFFLPLHQRFCQNECAREVPG